MLLTPMKFSDQRLVSRKARAAQSLYTSTFLHQWKLVDATQLRMHRFAAIPKCRMMSANWLKH
jgi:hypothetical protein